MDYYEKYQKYKKKYLQKGGAPIGHQKTISLSSRLTNILNDTNINDTDFKQKFYNIIGDNTKLYYKIKPIPYNAIDLKKKF